MRPLLTTVLVFLLVSSCARRSPKPEYSVAGTYEVTHFGGETLPVSLSDGRVLTGGTCLLSTSRSHDYYSFELEFSFDGEAQGGESGPQNRYGEYRFRNPSDGQPYLHFRIVWTYGMRREVHWEARGALMGNTLTIQLEEGESVFRKLRKPR